MKNEASESYTYHQMTNFRTYEDFYFAKGKKTHLRKIGRRRVEHLLQKLKAAGGRMQQSELFRHHDDVDWRHGEIKVNRPEEFDGGRASIERGRKSGNNYVAVFTYLENEDLAKPRQIGTRGVEWVLTPAGDKWINDNRGTVLGRESGIIENYNPGKETEIRVASDEEKKAFLDRMGDVTISKSDQNLIDTFDVSDVIHGAFEDGEMIGGVTFKDSEYINRATEIPVMLIDPGHRKEGIGKMLVNYVSDYSQNEMIVVNPYTQESEDFFKKLGFIMNVDIHPSDPKTMVKTI